MKPFVVHNTVHALGGFSFWGISLRGVILRAICLISRFFDHSQTHELHTHIHTLRPAGLYEETDAGPGRLSGE